MESGPAMACDSVLLVVCKTGTGGWEGTAVDSGMDVEGQERARPRVPPSITSPSLAPSSGNGHP